MHPIAVESTLLASVSYSSGQRMLQLQFRDGSRYRYFDVPVELYRQLVQSDSKGAYFNRYIRNQFRFQELT
jgi:hypothetical protein